MAAFNRLSGSRSPQAPLVFPSFTSSGSNLDSGANAALHGGPQARYRPLPTQPYILGDM